MSEALFQELESRIRQLLPSPAVAEAPLMPAPVFPTDEADVARLAAEAREKAAVVAWFTPKSLIDGTGRPRTERVLSQLVPECDGRPARYGHEWCLRREPRREVLTALAADRGRLQRVLRATEHLAVDPDAQLLRRVLRGERVKAGKAGTLADETRGGLLRVAEWTDGIFPNAPKPADVQGLLARDAIRQSLSVLGEKFHGRRIELELLQQFVFRGRSKSADGTSRPPVLALSGIGGVGKSALLSRFMRGLLARPHASRPIVVLIDFDRARFSSGDPVALTFELTRQIAAWCPALATELRELRHSARINLFSSGFAAQIHASTAGLESNVRSGDELKYRLPRVLARGGVGTRRRLVIVLDTFEVLQGSPAEATQDDVGVRGVHAVAEWINDLFYTSGLSKMRVIVAGRAPIAEDPVFGGLLTEPELRLTGVERPAALALLRDQGVKGRDARHVADALADPKDGSCNPLMFRLAARLVKAGTVRADSLQRGIAKGRRAIDQELVQGVLYRRILAHIGEGEKDTTLATLAHPGLVLRRVTPDVIRRILVPLLLPKDRRKVDAVALFNRLRREVWLVRETGPQTVEHRADLRRTMLRLIDADLRQQAVRIHRAAVKFYRAGGDPGLSPEVAAGEAFYHTLMLMTRARARTLNATDVRRHESSLLPSLDDLPPHVLAVVKSILDRPLTDAEGLALPEPQRTQFILRQGERCVRNDEPYRALALLERTDLHPYWELQALAATVAWREAKARGLLGPFVEPPTPGAIDDEQTDRANLATWVAQSLGDTQGALSISEGVLASLDPARDWTTIDVRLLEQLARRINYRTAAARDAGRLEFPEHRIPWTALNTDHINSTSMALEATRQAVFGIGDAGWNYRVVFSGEMLPPCRRLLDALAASGLPRDLARRIRTVAKGLGRTGSRLSSGEILGDVARTFPTAVVLDPATWPALRDHWPLLSPNPEFRGPVKYALLDGFKTASDLSLVAETAARVLEVHPRDLDPKVFVRTATRHRSPGAEIAKLVLFLDRSAALGAFLEELHRRRPKLAKLTLVTGAFTRWQRAFVPIERPVTAEAAARPVPHRAVQVAGTPSG